MFSDLVIFMIKKIGTIKNDKNLKNTVRSLNDTIVIFASHFP